MPILVIGFLLLFFGLAAIYSVSIYKSFQFTLIHFSQPSNYFYFFRHLKYVVIAIIVWFIVYKIPIEYIKKYKNKIFVFFLFLQLLVFTPLGLKLKWASWWISVPIPWFSTLQPAEFFKLAFVIFLSGWLLKKKKFLHTPEWFLYFIIVVWIFFLIFLKIPDLGTLLVLGPVSLIMYRYAGWKFKYVLALLILWLVGGLTIWMQFSYIKQRVNFFLNPDIDTTWRWIWWQTKQALIAVGAWGFLGEGYWKWLQKFWYIPEAYSDFIFAAFSEEIGFIWDLLLLFLYFLFVWYVLKNLKYITDDYYKVLAVGIISLIFIQVFVNIWVNIKLLPITGITLPFISYGWTALIVNVVEIVLLYKILKYSKNLDHKFR